MANDDALLMQLRALRVPHDLAALDDGVLTGLRDRLQTGAVSRMALGTCGALALGIGIAGGSITGSTAVANAPGLSLSGASALAPSNLLEGR